MGFNRKDLSRVKQEFSEKYRIAHEASDQRRFELWAKIDGLRAIDNELSMTGIRIMDAVMSKEKGSDTATKVEAIKRENQALLLERAALLRAYGYPEDYTDVHYECEKCGDTGYVDMKMCDCMKRALVLAGYESSGIASLMQTQSFENFSLDYYKQSQKQYDGMKKMYEKIKSFADNFGADTYENFLFLGGTGLGKTHLSTAVAKIVIDKCFDVLYVTANDMISTFEQKKFGSKISPLEEADTSRYYSADLLIIDDLGTEMATQFSVSTIYEIINARIMARKSTIISTNLGNEELQKRYWDRITSRIFGEYQPVLFVGTDIRRQKISAKN